MSRPWGSVKEDKSFIVEKIKLNQTEQKIETLGNKVCLEVSTVWPDGFIIFNVWPCTYNIERMPQNIAILPK